MENELFLQKIALKTWNYFSDFSMKSTNYFPPDNIQVFSHNKIAPYTSISNIGFYLLSCLTAYELKFITLSELIERLQSAVESFTQMERNKGHFYNWYDLKTLKASKPMYISTVDSGNLAADFIVLAESLRLAISEYEFNKNFFNGFLTHLEIILESKDTLDSFLIEKITILHNDIKSSGDSIADIVDIIHKITVPTTNIQNATKNANRQIEKEISRLGKMHENFLYEIESFYPDKPEHIHQELESFVSKIDSSKSLVELRSNIQEAVIFLSQNPELDPDYLLRLNLSLEFILDKEKRAKTIADWMDAIVRDMNFSFLYNSKLKAISIGYKSQSDKIEKYHYQTLASESRLAVFISIAKDDLPKEAWDNLNRNTREGKRGPFIVSWSGTMFEYFMPDIFMKCSDNSIYNQTYLNYLEEQKSYAAKLGIPWGLSESCYYSFNKDKEYRYKAFGIASAALDPNVSEKPVISSYSTFLSMRHDMKAGTENLLRLINDGGMGEYGFFESIDYSTGTPQVVKTYMSHHQGMILCSICNILKDNKLIRLFHTNKEIKSIEYMLEENKSGPVTMPKIDIPNKDNLIYK